MQEKGKLYIVSTPIGNMEDITYRAVRILKEVSYIAAEDTRHSRILLNKLDIDTRLVSFHEYSSREKAERIVGDLLEGNDIALITDAGTPIISDPGVELTKLAAKEGIEILTVPGPCAAIAAITVSALDARRFIFEGFLPKDNSRKDMLKKIMENEYTSIVYESPHHLLDTLRDIALLDADREISVCKELTKVYENVFRGSAKEIYDSFSGTDIKGEYIIVISGKEKVPEIIDDEAIIRCAEKYAGTGLRTKEIAAKVSEELGIGKNQVYKLLIEQ
ncbi:MAG: 16S rRNA (cytidine(1402)-2'-O)-methyltransferase [Clostridia bacterium]|nr:16S rRNA (cytidine(1402)-2'-O)-methyltransferase [Clostridia bacterium]